MPFEAFESPGISWPIVRRRASDELLVLLMGFGEALFTRGRSLTWNQSFPSDQAYRSAVSRLRRTGLLAARQADGSTPILKPTDAARTQAPISLRPEKRWKRKWPGYWYLLTYDVPEKDRRYRDILRKFLANMRMGCLQKSVWITPDDIRPEYEDLSQAAAVKQFSFLLQSRTVLNRNTDYDLCHLHSRS